MVVLGLGLKTKIFGLALLHPALALVLMLLALLTSLAAVFMLILSEQRVRRQRETYILRIAACLRRSRCKIFNLLLLPLKAQ
jgi:hypothetical protein